MRIVAFDLETERFGPFRMAPPIICLSWATKQTMNPEDKRDLLVVGKDQIHAWLKRHLQDPTVIFAAHFAAYDFSCIVNEFSDLMGLVWSAYEQDRVVCTATAERLLDCARGRFRWAGKETYELGFIAKRRLEMDLDKSAASWRIRFDELANTPASWWPYPAVEYAVDDSLAVLFLLIDQQTRAKSLGYNLPTLYEDGRADFALRLTSVNGVVPDQERVERVHSRIVGEMHQLIATLEPSGLVYEKPQNFDLSRDNNKPAAPEIKRNTKRIKALVEECHPNPPRTPTGEIQTTKDVLEECDHPDLARLVQLTHKQKMVSTYLQKFFAPIIHARFHAIGATSDRTSASGPNMQNTAQELWECFNAREGRVLLSSDFDSQEMRTLGQACLDITGSSSLSDRYNENPRYDPHTEFAAGLAGISVEDALRLKKQRNPRLKELRQRAKAANFGYPGGMGAETFIRYARGYGVRLSLEGSKELRDHWMAQRPEMRAYFDHVSTLVEQHLPHINTQSGYRRGGCGYTDAANGYFQTLAAHSSKAALFRICKQAYTNRNSWLYGSRPWLFIHDEVILETPEEAGHEAATEIVEHMVEAMAKWTPNIPPAAGAMLMRRWQKADPEYDRNGRMIPVEDAVK